jgi:hypothetical protein
VFPHLAQKPSIATPPACAVARHIALQHCLLVPMGLLCSGRPTPAHTAIFRAPPRARSRHPLGAAHVPLLHRPRTAPVLRLPAHVCRLEPPAPRHQLRRAALPATAAALLHANIASAAHRAAPVPALRRASAASPAPASRFPAEPLRSTCARPALPRASSPACAAAWSRPDALYQWREERGRGKEGFC